MSAPSRMTIALPEQVRARVAAGQITVPTLDPREALAESPEDAAERVRVAHRIRRTRWSSRLPSRYAAASLASLSAQQDPGGVVSRWWTSESLTLVLVSATPGVGKTHGAYAVGNDAVDRGAWAEGWSVIELLTAMRPDGDVDALDRAVRCDLLVLDDLGREKDTDWTREQVHHILDKRIGQGARQVITTNLGGDAMGVRYSDPLVDRLVDGATIVTVAGESRRRPVRW